MANTIAPSIAVKISANAAGFAQTVNNAANSLKVLEQRAKFANNLLAGFGVGFGAYQIASVVTDVVKSMATFEAEMSKVKAVTKATDEEFGKLSESALNLSAAFGVNKTGVAALQTQYARLGFSTSEILLSTKAAIQLSRATGEDLAKSAQIAGSTLRSFNLDAREMNRVADIMATAFNKSALGLDDFGEAIKYVAPVAANANITLEQTSAMLAVLADSGIKGSQAGTSLRKILTDLGVNAGPMLTQKLKEMAAAGLSQADAFDEVGRTAYTSLLVLVKNLEKVQEYTVALKDNKGALDSVASVVKDNLIGDWEKFTAAIGKTIETGSGLNLFFRKFLQDATDLTRFLSGDFRSSMEVYIQNIVDANKVDVDRKRILEETNTVIARYGLNLKEVTKGFDTDKELGGLPGAWQLAIDRAEILLEVQSRIKKANEAETQSIRNKVDALAAEIKKKEDLRKLLDSKLGFYPGVDDGGQAKSTYGVDMSNRPAIDSNNAFAESLKNVTNNALVTGSTLVTLTNDIVPKMNEAIVASQQFINGFANAFMALGEGIGSVVSGSQTAAEAFRRYADDIVRSIGRMIMAQMIQKAIQDKTTDFNFFAKLALIGVATGVASGLIRKIGASSSGGGASNARGSSYNSDISSRGRDVRLTGDFIVRGPDLVLAIRNQNYKGGRLG